MEKLGRKDFLIIIIGLILGISLIICTFILRNAMTESVNLYSQIENTKSINFNNTVSGIVYQYQKDQLEQQKEILTENEAADFLKIPFSKIRALVLNKANSIPHVKIDDDTYLFSRSALIKWLGDSGQVTP